MRQCLKTLKARYATGDNTAHAPSVNSPLYWTPHTVHNEDIQSLINISAE